MCVKNWLRTSVLVPALTLAMIPTFAKQQQQSPTQPQTGDPVAEAARKAREQKKAAAKPKKVYTEDDIPSRGGAAASPAPAAKAETGSDVTKDQTPKGQAAGAEAEGADADKDKNDEATWRKKFRAQREKIAQAETELNILQREVEKSQVQFYADPQKAMQEQNSRKDINEKDAKIAAKKKEIESLKQQLEDMELAMKRAGGDSGWARE